jgi:hypothetical protein
MFIEPLIVADGRIDGAMKFLRRMKLTRLDEFKTSVSSWRSRHSFESVSALPVTGAAFQMASGDDDDFGRPETVDDLIWKARDQHAPGLRIVANERTLRRDLDAAPRTSEQRGSVRPTLARWCEAYASPAEYLFLDPALHVFPSLQLDGTSLDRGDAASDFDLPRRLGVWVGRAIETGEQFRRQFSARLDVQLKGVREDRFSSLGHSEILRPL